MNRPTWQDFKKSDLVKSFIFRVVEMLAWKIGRNCFIREINFWLRLVLLVAVNFEFFSMYNLLLTDEGYLHLRFVRIVEKDGRRDGRNQPLYFIGTELDYLRNMSKLDRDEQSEKIKKLVYLGLLISKWLNNFTSLGWLGCLFLPQLVFLPDILQIKFEKQLKKFLETNDKEKAIAEGNANSRFRSFEQLRFTYTTIISGIVLVFLPWFTAQDSQWGDARKLIQVYKLSLDSSAFHILSIALAIKFVANCQETLATPSFFKYLPQFCLISALISNLLFCDDKFPSLLALAYIIAALRKTNKNLWLENITNFTDIAAVIHSSILVNFKFGLSDTIFLVALIFIYRVGKYRPGAVKLSNMFTFMYIQVFLVSVCIIMLNLESFNFTDTDILWNLFPKQLNYLVLKLLFYMLLLCVFLNSIQHVRLFFDDHHEAPERNTIEYEGQVVSNFIMRDFFGMVPLDSTTVKSIEAVNKRNILILFILTNIYFYNSWFSLFFNICFVIYTESMAGQYSYRGLNFGIQTSKFLLRFSRPFQLFLLRYFIWLTEEMGLDERYLRLLFFDISEVGRKTTCNYVLYFLDTNSFTEKFACHFEMNWMFVCGYIIVALHILIVPLVKLLKPGPDSASLAADFMMVFQEVTLVVLLTVGLCFGFYKDLLIVASSVYILLSPKRVGFDSFS